MSDLNYLATPAHLVYGRFAALKIISQKSVADKRVMFVKTKMMMVKEFSTV